MGGHPDQDRRPTPFSPSESNSNRLQQNWLFVCLRNKDDRGFPASQACSATVLLPQCAQGDGEGRRGHSLRGYLLKKKNT